MHGKLPTTAGLDERNEDKFHEECGIFGVWNGGDAAALTALGLHALQHRGQIAAGIVSYDGERFHAHRGLGLVGDIFSNAKVITSLPGSNAVGHNRYATTGDTALRNVQPLYADSAFGGFAVAHNGNLTNASRLRRNLVQRGCIFQSTTDSEVFIHLVAMEGHSTVVDRLVHALKRVVGAYSLLALSNDALIGARDPIGVRPLVLGRLPNASSAGWVLASETCALDIVGAKFIRDLEPGEVLVINDTGLRSIKPSQQLRSHFCVFEYIYFARPDSLVEGLSVYEARKRIGRELAREANVSADLVVPVPDSGVPAAMGYAAEVGLPFEFGIIRNHYVGRTFIEPTDHIRHLGVKLKHSANGAVLSRKRVVLVDDSIVRGTTSRKIVEVVRQAGAAEVHVRISSPPTKHSCFYGIDTPKRNALLAAENDISKMASLIDADSLAFISLNGLYRALGWLGHRTDQATYCDACFTGQYPIPTLDYSDGTL